MSLIHDILTLPCANIWPSDYARGHRDALRAAADLVSRLGTAEHPQAVLTFQPGGAQGNWPTFRPGEPVLVARPIGRLWFFDSISRGETDTRSWPEWSSVVWYCHLEGITLPVPAESEGV